MKPKFILILSLIFHFQEHFAGCGPVKCMCSNGIVTYSYPYLNNAIVDTVYITNEDSITIYLSRIGGCDIGFLGIKINGMSANYVTLSNFGGGSMHLRLKGISGHYVISSTYGGQAFDLIMNTVGIPKLFTNSEQITIFPNPARDEVQLCFKSQELKTASLLNALGKEIQRFEINSETLRIPLDTYPSGIYFIRVATLTDKVIIKKITVL